MPTISGWDATVTPASGFGGGLSSSTFSNLGGAVQDLFGAFASGEKAKGAAAEASNYGLAAGLARQNAEFSDESTKIKTMQQNRETFQVTGQQQADVASAGFEESGSALDILRNSAAQGALTAGVLAKQGAITETGYQEQAKSYDTMQQAALQQEKADKEGGIFGFLSAGIKVASAVAPLLL